MLNLRNQQGHVRQRYVAISNDGGQTWAQQYFDKNLPDPVCEGSILTIGKRFLGKNVLAFSNAANPNKRDDLTLRISKNNGKTWYKSIPVHSNPSINDAAAYSDIVKVDKNHIGVFYEKDGYSSMVFRLVKWK